MMVLRQVSSVMFIFHSYAQFKGLLDVELNRTLMAYFLSKILTANVFILTVQYLIFFTFFLPLFSMTLGRHNLTSSISEVAEQYIYNSTLFSSIFSRLHHLLLLISYHSSHNPSFFLLTFIPFLTHQHVIPTQLLYFACYMHSISMLIFIMPVWQNSKSLHSDCVGHLKPHYHCTNVDTTPYRSFRGNFVQIRPWMSTAYDLHVDS